MTGSRVEPLQLAAAKPQPALSAAHRLRGGLRRRWRGWSLARQFVTCASVVLLPAMGLIGWWVSGRIEDSVVNRAAISAALYMENFVEPLVQDLADDKPLSPLAARTFERLLADTTLGQRVQTFKIWARGDVVVASSRSEIIGKSYPASAGLTRAWTGAVSAQLDHLAGVESEAERTTGQALLEIYIPVRQRGTDRIVAVGEFYERATDLRRELNEAQAMSWLVVAAVTLAMLSALSGLVWRGSRTIDDQQASLERRVGDLTLLLEENAKLRRRVQSAAARASETNERMLRRFGAELHDGPAQLVSLALLRLDEDHTGPPSGGRKSVRQVLTDALVEIRQLAAGLAAPEIEGLTLAAAVAAVVQRHSKLSGQSVALTCEGVDSVLAPATTLCACRFVQEGLANGLKHGGGVRQSVRVARDGTSITVEVVDGGQGALAERLVQGLGLRGLSDRMESLGGSLAIETRPGAGFKLTGRLPLSSGG